MIFVEWKVVPFLIDDKFNDSVVTNDNSTNFIIIGNSHGSYSKDNYNKYKFIN